MSADIHPITRRIIDALKIGGAEGMEMSELKLCANLVLDTPDAYGLGVELIALARRMADNGAAAIAEQIVILAGFALGDASGASVTRLDEKDDGENASSIPTFKSTKAPAGSVAGGPLARVSAALAIEQKTEGESACPFHRVMGKFSRKRKTV